jgi:hypothetical protein
MGGRPPLRIEGQRFGRLIVLRHADRRRFWVCRCDCGNEREIFSSSLIQGETASCGCLRHERWVARRTKHGMAKTREWNAWHRMLGRCYDPKNISFANYGGRGIQVCPDWRHDFSRFYADIGPAPSPDHSLDRIDTNGHYEPGNCRWATRAEQMRNKRSNCMLEIDGRRMTVAEWARKYGVPHQRVRERLSYGWTPIDALTRPPRKLKPR